MQERPSLFTFCIHWAVTQRQPTCSSLSLVTGKTNITMKTHYPRTSVDVDLGGEAVGASRSPNKRWAFRPQNVKLNRIWGKRGGEERWEERRQTLPLCGFLTLPLPISHSWYSWAFRPFRPPSAWKRAEYASLQNGRKRRPWNSVYVGDMIYSGCCTETGLCRVTELYLPISSAGFYDTIFIEHCVPSTVPVAICFLWNILINP